MGVIGLVSWRVGIEPAKIDGIHDGEYARSQ